MGYFYRRYEDDEKIVLELRTKNAGLYAAFLMALTVPAAWVAGTWFADNSNVVRIPLVLAVLATYAVLDGKAFAMILRPGKKERTGSPFSVKNPVRYTFPK